MRDCNLKKVSTPVQKIIDPLTELLRNGARDLIRKTIEAQLGMLLGEDAKDLSAKVQYPA